MIFRYGMVVSTLIVYPYGLVANWELWLPDADRRHERGSGCVSLTQEKIQVQNSERGFYWIYIGFAPSEVKKIKLSHCKLRTVFTDLELLKLSQGLFINTSFEVERCGQNVIMHLFFWKLLLKEDDWMSMTRVLRTIPCGWWWLHTRRVCIYIGAYKSLCMNVHRCNSTFLS